MRRAGLAVSILLGLMALLFLGGPASPSAGAYPAEAPHSGAALDKGSGGGAAAPGRPATVIIPGTPLRVEVQPTGTYGVWRNGVQQFWAGNAEGVFLWVNGVVWGSRPPATNDHLFTPISETLTGDGSPGNPWVATTIMEAGTTGIQIAQQIYYVDGQEYIRNIWTLCNTAPRDYLNVQLFHAADLYTDGNDNGYGYYDPATGAIGGYNQSFTLYQIFIPITTATHYEENYFGAIWNAIANTNGPGFNDSYLTTLIDNGAGLQWAFNLGAGECSSISDFLSFSDHPVLPSATAPPSNTPLPTSTPGPTHTPTPAATPTCPAAHPERYLIVYADNGVNPTTLQNQIRGLIGPNGVVDTFNGELGTPSLALLRQYDAVVAFTYFSFIDADTLGDNLADYEDEGGVVVVFDYSWFINANGRWISGRWSSDQYSPFTLTGLAWDSPGHLDHYLSGHPLMQGVTTLNAFHRLILDPAPGASVVAQWQDQRVLVAYKGRAVGVEAYVGDMLGQWSGDFGRIVVNAARWLNPQGCVNPTATPARPTVTPAPATQTPTPQPTTCAGQTPTRVPTPAFTPAPGCTDQPRPGDLRAVITDHAGTTDALFTNRSATCSYRIGLAIYKKLDANIDHQVLYDYQLAVIPPHSTLVLTANNPPCAYQGDAFWGDLIESFANGDRYGTRRLDDTDGNGANYCPPGCPPAATATPSTRTQAPPKQKPVDH